MSNCRVCGSRTKILFEKQILGRFPATFSLCGDCEFLQADNPSWLDEAYKSPLADVDTGLIERPNSLRVGLVRLIQGHLNPGGRFLDFGGGSGVLTRMMRDLGYDFFHHDPFAKNIFARGFDYADLSSSDRRFELTTAVEVLEHAPEPVKLVKDLLKESPLLLVSTELRPVDVASLENWAYIGAHHGQHISFGTEKTMHKIAELASAHYSRAGEYLHIFSKTPMSAWLDDRGTNRLVRGIRKILDSVFRTKRYWLSRRRSLIETDNQKITQNAMQSAGVRYESEASR